MKKILSLLVLLFSFTLGFSESAKPLWHVEVERRVISIDIEGTMYYGATINIKSSDALSSSVKVKIKDDKGKVIYKHKFKQAYLYIFSSGQIQIGKPSFDRMVIYKSDYSNSYTGIIRDKEGVY